MLGQQPKINVSLEPRPATPQEALIWRKFKDHYKSLTTTAKGIVSTAHVGAEFQTWFTNHNLPITTWDETDQRYIDAFLHRYNIIGRLIQGAEMNKYFMRIERGDLEIVAPPHMPREEYEADIYPRGAIDQELGVLPLVIAGLVGVGLIVGGIIATEVLEYSAKARDDEYRKKVLEADLEMLKAPKETQEQWRKYKQQSSDLIEKANKTHKTSWFQSLFGGGLGGIGGGIAVLLGLLIAYQVTKKR